MDRELSYTTSDNIYLKKENMDPHFVYVALAALMSFSFLLLFWKYFSDQYHELYNLLFQRLSNEQIFILKEGPVLESLAHLSKKIDDIKNISFPKPGEEPNSYIKRMGWDLNYHIYKKRRPYKRSNKKENVVDIVFKKGSKK
jgi:hypothetical protein